MYILYNNKFYIEFEVITRLKYNRFIKHTSKIVTYGFNINEHDKSIKTISLFTFKNKVKLKFFYKINRVEK
jgi:hypothetical protein